MRGRLMVLRGLLMETDSRGVYGSGGDGGRYSAVQRVNETSSAGERFSASTKIQANA